MSRIGRVAPAAVVALTLVMVGCAPASPTTTPTATPAHTPASTPSPAPTPALPTPTPTTEVLVELVGAMTIATHAGDRGIEAYPGHPAPAPSSCVAYLDGQVRPQDTCTVYARDFEWEGLTYPWTVSAMWYEIGEWDDAMIRRLAVVAFDEAGHPIAGWAGRMHPNAGHLTE